MSRPQPVRRARVRLPSSGLGLRDARAVALKYLFAKPREEYSGLPPNLGELACWDALDNGLQLVRFIPLFLYAFHGVPRPRTLVASIFNPSAFVITRTVQRRVRIAIYKGLMLSSESVANIRRIVLLGFWIQVLVRRAVAHICGVHPEPQSKTERLAVTGEVIASLGEAFDVLAFLTGTGMFWSALGWSRGESKELLHRRRYGLERIGVMVSLVAIPLQIYVTNRRSKEDKEALELLPEHTSESILFRRRLHWNAVERICLVADGSFTLLEALAPDADKEAMEASTGLLAALLRLRRVWSEACYGGLEL